MAAEAAVSLAVETLGNLLIEKVVFLKGVEGDVEWMRDELKRMQCFLKDAANKQSDSDRIRNWISEIREVAHDAEDAIEKFVLNVESRELLQRFASFPVYWYHLYNIGSEIKSIRKRLKDIESSRLSYGIQNLGESSRSRSQLEVESRRRLAYWQQDSDVVGLEKDVDLLLDKAIFEERGGLSVASIIGMGGIGKSTLANKIYNHPRITNQFECRAWVVVSSEFTEEDIMKQILMQLGISLDRLKLLECVDDKLRRQQNLQEEVCRFLTGKRYFIVLDDVWEPSHWRTLANSFPREADKESRLLLTSRNQDMGGHNQYVHNMKVLDPNQSWKLFVKKAFIENSVRKCPKELQNIGEEILKWCGGLPLAISVIGGLLQKKTPSKSEWEKVAKEMKSRLKRNKDIDSILAILELSYHNLPPELKACFLFLGFFKEDAVIEAKDLIHIWVAQGLVAQEVVGEEESMEDVATDYLNQLISRNMIQVKRSKYDVVKDCHMHDLLRDLSQRKAKEEINMEILMKEKGDSHHSLHKPRHRAMYNIETRSLSSTSRNHYLRSLFIIGLCYGHEAPSSYWKSFERLRVLDLRDTWFKVLPKAIGALTGLRYIKMRYIGPTSKLPRSWAKLTNLQVLDLWYSKIVGHIIIDKVILKMKSLQHLYANISSSKVSLSNMKKLQTLTLFPLKDSSVWQIQGMAGVTTLGLDIYELENIYASKLFTHLATLENLVSLTFRNGWIGAMDGLAALRHITKLKLEKTEIRYLDTRTNFPPKLSYLTLSGMSSDKDPMPVLERLPELLYLKMVDVWFGGEIVITRHGFPKLKVLHFQSIERLRNIQVKKGGMPDLKQLFIQDCSNLNIETLPKHLKSLPQQMPLFLVGQIRRSSFSDDRP